MTTRTDRPSVPLRPLVSWPEEAEAGRRYLVTVDVEFDAADGAWPYDSEEYAIGCMLEGEPRLAVESVGNTTLVLHRFGGTYGPVRFVTYPVGDGPGGDTALRLTLITAGGVPFRSERLPVRLNGAGQGSPVTEIEVALPAPGEPEVPEPDEEEAEEETGTVLILTASDTLHAAVAARLTDRRRLGDGLISGTLVGTERHAVLMPAVTALNRHAPYRQVAMAAGRDHGATLVMSLVHGQGAQRRLEFGDVVVATEVELPGLTVRPSPRLVDTARVVMGNSAYYERVRADNPRDEVCLTAAYATPAAEHFTVCAVGRAAVDRAAEVLTRVLGNDAPRTDRLSLPPVPAAFTGRESDLNYVLGLLDARATITEQRYTLVNGMPGIGKSALAVAAARAAVERGWFPGGAYWIPSGPDAAGAVALARSRLREGRWPVLIVHDGTTWEEATRTWNITARSRFHVLLTSRGGSGVPEERRRVLHPLSLAASTAVLDAPGSERRAAEALADLCGGVPLALRIAAHQPGRLAETRTHIEGSGGIFHAFDDLRDVFDAEYASLTSRCARTLRLLAAVPGDDLGPEPTEELFFGDDEAVRALLDTGMAVRRDRRLRVLELPKAYVQQVLTEDEEVRSEAAQARAQLLSYCLDRTKDAVRVLGTEGRPGDDRPERREDALAWLDGEHPSLIAQIRESPADAVDAQIVDLTLHLVAYLNWRRHFALSLDCCTAALERDTGPRESAQLWNLRGEALCGTGQLADATAAHLRALALHEEAGDAWGAAKAREALGRVAEVGGQWESARDHYTAARDALARVGDRRGEAAVELSLGSTLLKMGGYAEGFDTLRRATEISRSLGDRPGTARALLIRAEALCSTGGVQEAIGPADEAIALYGELGDVHAQAQAIEVRARAREELHQYPAARDDWEAAKEAYEQAGDTTAASRADRRSGVVIRGASRVRSDASVLVMASGAAMRRSSVRWSIYVSKGSRWDPKHVSYSWTRREALMRELANPLRGVLAGTDTQYRPTPVAFALPLRSFDLAPHTWPAPGREWQSLGTQRPVTIRFADRPVSSAKQWSSVDAALRRAEGVSAWHVPIGANPASVGGCPRGAFPVLCGPVSRGPGREIMSRLLTRGHGVVLWTTAPHPGSCGSECDRLRAFVDRFLSGVGSVAELPRALWWLRVQGGDHQLSLLYDEPGMHLPGFDVPE
ncbi:hypothetical protein BN159_4010 [Streptomyces davaonensis JCM 4913]|uniref:Uncharacterized protein n=1 Tax=Streptomyces davaonensis (strain DSM 101723 / JCM 4913 / KCC S-0913 / 768) TaxID=1214101 RepID=K4R6R6_STRDJ|nr:tetratricopeptide repeat protein [Streptomyces davaonensis]CCK28389.1 hypothetical protein BN159_4010 [Streptomyces davaonensis JCM 4913]